MHSISNEHEDQAATLGIGKIRRFIFITLPMLRPAIAYTSILCLACVFGSFELPSILGGKQFSLVMLAYSYYSQGWNSPYYMESFAISVVVAIIILSISFVLMYYSISSNEKRDRR